MTQHCSCHVVAATAGKVVKVVYLMVIFSLCVTL